MPGTAAVRVSSAESLRLLLLHLPAQPAVHLLSVARLSWLLANGGRALVLELVTGSRTGPQGRRDIDLPVPTVGLPALWSKLAGVGRRLAGYRRRLAG